ncbi:TPA: carbamoyltransferase HypF, partial [Candidatus Sumerlaeota bacterium]|nr:carbamoyltransferase HypF [Candidatus Sumerlaeota bacterium]
MENSCQTIRHQINLSGRVQGVGFRPFVYRLATELELAGKVENDAQGAVIEIEGASKQTSLFLKRLQSELPPLAKIAHLEITGLPPKNDKTFVIACSKSEGARSAEISPDIAICPDCLRELFDPADRRYRYPFINCTNCGPRYSIVQAVPYDRCNTTMTKFKMCPDCQAEYDDPTNRRFHAQPDACPVCGPRLWLTDAQGRDLPGDPIRVCAELLRDGKIVAIKGVGGFHLACCADNDAAVERLRERKGREAKPFALMLGSLENARKLICLDSASETQLLDCACPIVLAPRCTDAPISRFVAPGNALLGVMLPYAPLHHLLFAEGLGALVMTSGNPSEEPLCKDNAEALERLGHLADAFLMHDRDMERGVDDSVVLAGGPVVRRGRGYAPGPVRLKTIAALEPVLAIGGEMKSAICILNDNVAVLSEHLGELSNPSGYRNFAQTIERFQKLLSVTPRVIAHDLHPDYASTRFARSLPDATLIPIQHHHAHAASCMAENGLSRAVAVVCDGTGYGTDAQIWGGEILVCERDAFERAGHLCYYALPGGDAAAHETWRPALSLTLATFETDWQQEAGTLFNEVPAQTLKFTAQRIQSGSFVQTSSTGRLFDAAAFLLGLCERNRFEAEAAMLLESVAQSYSGASPNALPPASGLLDWKPLVRNLVVGMRQGVPVPQLAYAFHSELAILLTSGALAAAQRNDITQVVLTGGCFANRLLTALMMKNLEHAGLEVFTHHEVPPGDGGLALGQA